MWSDRGSPALALVLAVCLPSGAASKIPDLPQAEDLVIARTNDFRREQGLAALRHNRELEETARAFAAFMAREGVFSHEADGASPAARAVRHGYDHCVIAENIARQYSTAGFATAELARGLVEGWKSSPGHRKNMVNADVVETGVGIARRIHKGYPDYYYAVQLFGLPGSARIKFEIRNNTATAVRYRVGERAFTLAPRYSRTHTECGPRRLAFEGRSGQPFTAGKGDKFFVDSTRGEVSIRRE